MGSVALTTQDNKAMYRASKAALNSLTRGMMARLDPAHPVLVLHPGWVATDMGGASADLDVPTSVKGLATVLEDPPHVERLPSFSTTPAPNSPGKAPRPPPGKGRGWMAVAGQSQPQHRPIPPEPTTLILPPMQTAGLFDLQVNGYAGVDFNDAGAHRGRP